YKKLNNIHMVGIGGTGMSGIAEVLKNLGYEVTGSDIRATATTERLAGLGIKVHIGHEALNVEGAHVVVVSSAVKDDNPEVVEAAKRHIPVIPRAEMLAELGRLKYSLLVAGSHGKTTTTSLLSTILAHAGLDPTVVIGGKLKALGTNAVLGSGEFLVAEADESDGSFLKLNPTVGIVTNIDREHMDYFRDMDTLKEAFLTFMNNVPFYGLSVVCVDDPNVKDLVPEVHRKLLTYGFSEDAELRAANVEQGFMKQSFEAFLRGVSIGRFELPVPGRHSVLNCLATIAVSMELKVPVEKIREALKGFEGIQRRMEFKGEGHGVRVYDDYGHHPTEITATLEAARGAFSGGRLIVVFQPHRYSRTQDLMDEFAQSFGSADKVVLLDIYAASEQPIEGVDSKALAAQMDKGLVEYATSMQEAVQMVCQKAKQGDMVLTLGAGNVWKAGEDIVRKLNDG
ncbi:MAG: UDP-N-acetylmuramate--L-alanine ligase, partial [Thermodesulfovibrionales bacterium]|nr:UDP-N-acetylmuramate--L-alanine ligase [Thermodesulfovibrionales bacterium]